MHNYQHRMVPDMDETGFGVKYENNLSATNNTNPTQRKKCTKANTSVQFAPLQSKDF